jgi:hypothetical protein
MPVVATKTGFVDGLDDDEEEEEVLQPTSEKRIRVASNKYW